MAVAEKTIAEKTPRSPHQVLALKSLLGAICVLFSLYMIFGGLPTIWGYVFLSSNEFLSSSLLLVVVLAAAVGFFFLGRFLEGPNPPHGLRAGSFFVCVFFLLIVWITHGFGALLAGKELGAFGLLLTVGLAGFLLFMAVRLFRKPGFAVWLGHMEDQGWFHGTSFKPNQGVRVRRGTLLAILALGVCGIITLISHQALGSSRLVANDWEISIPFTENRELEPGYLLYLAVPIMYRIDYTMPVVLGILMVWLAWRVVNWPVFADFLIATEAEMNKVSWTTRKRLFQDTIVVLVTVILLTVFLFVVDILWIQILGSPFVDVLKVDVRAQQQKQQEKTQW